MQRVPTSQTPTVLSQRCSSRRGNYSESSLITNSILKENKSKSLPWQMNSSTERSKMTSSIKITLVERSRSQFLRKRSIRRQQQYSARRAQARMLRSRSCWRNLLHMKPTKRRRYLIQLQGMSQVLLTNPIQPLRRSQVWIQKIRKCLKALILIPLTDFVNLLFTLSKWMAIPVHSRMILSISIHCLELNHIKLASQISLTHYPPYPRLRLHCSNHLQNC